MIIYFTVICAVTVFFTVYDKVASKKYKSARVPEKFLLLLGLLGGALAQFVTMKIIRHKTRHKKFMIGLPVMIILQLALIAAILIYN